ncbi:MAG: tetratricopeptide repeat protein [Deltaproteobacteria bacterium]|nr:tetratricopeptide repeat protein [Deltaproteobacteria bacterium]
MNTDFNRDTYFAQAMSHFMNNNLGDSIHLLDEIVSEVPTDKMAYLTRGSAHLKLGQAEGAIEDFSRAIEIDAGYAKAHHMRGLAFEAAGDDSGALEDFNKAIEINPEYGAAYYSRAALLTKMGQEDAAAEDIQTVTHLTNVNIEQFANDNNVWRSRQMQLENIFETELNR